MVREICMVENFILPSLIDKKFGYLLEWVDEKEKIFKVFWSHKSRRQWTKALFAVFLEWDKIKGRTNLEEPEFFTKSKGRFRSALNRLSTCGKILKLRSSVIGYRMYQITDIQETSTPPHVPDVYVELPVDRAELDECLDLAGMYPDMNNEGKMIQLNSMQNDIVTPEESTDYYKDLPEDLPCSLDGLNGDILTLSNIEEPPSGPILPEDFFNFSLSEIISEDFLNQFFTDAPTLQYQ